MFVYIGKYPGTHKFFNKIWSFFFPERPVFVHLSNQDTWGMDDTLARIILPMLYDLKAEKQGAPFVDNIDVPKELRAPKEFTDNYNKNGETDENFFKRWDYVLDEMIWAFEQKVTDGWEDQYYTGVSDYIDEEIEYAGYPMFRLVPGPNHTLKFDKKGYTTHVKRMRKGFALFGKYYESLWN